MKKISIIKKKLNSLRWFVLNFLYFKKVISSKNSIFFDLNENKFDRYLYIFALQLEKEGYNLVFRINYGFLSSWSTFYLAKKTKNSYLSIKTPKNTLIKFYSSSRKAKKYGGKVISIDYFNDHEGYYIPMPLVDTFYIFNLDKKFIYDNINRNILVFFAGNFHVQSYSRNELKDIFNVESRHNTFDYIKHNIDQVYIPKNTVELSNGLIDPLNIMIVDRKQTNIKATQLPQYLIRSNFFLALPGVVMPLCHNVIEAMFFGVIPILMHNNLFHPPLINKHNCLIYSSHEELKYILNELKNLSADKINSMRLNVLEYYKNHLSSSAVINNLLNTKSNTVFLNAEYQSVKLVKHNK